MVELADPVAFGGSPCPVKLQEGYDTIIGQGTQVGQPPQHEQSPNVPQVPPVVVPPNPSYSLSDSTSTKFFYLICPSLCLSDPLMAETDTNSSAAIIIVTN